MGDHLSRLGFSDIPWINPRHTNPLGMDMHHDSVGGIFIVPKKPDEDRDHEFLRGVVIVMQDHLEHGWAFELDPIKRG